MWRRFTTQIRPLAAHRSAPSGAPNVSSSRSLYRPTSTLFSGHVCSDSGFGKKKLEDVMLIDTGNEYEAELQGGQLLHIDYPRGLFGTKGTSNIRTDFLKSFVGGVNSISLLHGSAKPVSFLQSMTPQTLSSRCFTTTNDSGNSIAEDPSLSGVAPRIKYKRLDKTARHIMQILDKEAVGEVKEQREIPDIQPGHIIQLKVEVPENKRRVSILKGIVIARRNAGLNSTFRLRRLVAGVGIESLFPLYSPNIKEIKVLDKKKVRRAKLYYLRDKMNALRK